MDDRDMQQERNEEHKALATADLAGTEAPDENWQKAQNGGPHGGTAGPKATAEERVALLFMDFRGRLITAGVLQQGALVYDMPLTQGELADHLGITAVHVNRVLKEFRDSGIMTVRDGHVSIQNLERLAQRAAPLLDVYERTDPAYAGLLDTQVPSARE